jgi:4,5-DOPA dioxygenase extradiol
MKMPVLFIAHGSPMNILAENEFTKSLQSIVQKIPLPKAILCISAHWTTKQQSFIHKNTTSQLIYDFYGFPDNLYRVQYPALGNPFLSNLIKKNILMIEEIPERGLDHGAWSILHHIYPKANIPVIQLSIDMTKNELFHYDLGQQLKFLREQGYLIIGSGNLTHNLKIVDWQNQSTQPSYDWCKDFDNEFQEFMQKRNYQKLIFYKNIKGANFGIQNPDHYFPFLYCLGAAGNSSFEYFYEGFELGTLNMRSILWHS